ncbi:alpha/beta fold hydrolase [Mesorhizobium sp. BR1-1-16]|uniref:alpha/beta hydrolase family protein n=1 Tax=Mesorhizobium sp. BR1-1-16 TaxID=2876653 RepID=UPI001CCD1787|nr:alpha/beta fold hydrolase [Mesorhizobium sp. BR1-1-16]MBZ9939082.1 alpha/beta fold hydrolase [Mesorhizobium sp. BR1-1-16]
MLKRLILPALLLISAAAPGFADDTDAMKSAGATEMARPAGATEESTVKITRGGETIVGTLEMPKGAVKPPVVLLLHGFTGSRDELAIKGTNEGIFSRTARILAERGIASLRIDFTGSGESSGKWEDMTATSEIADGIAAFDWLKTSELVDPTRIHVLGWSLGGLVAAHVAAERPVASATLWAAAADPTYNFAHFIGPEAVEAAIADPDPARVVEMTLPWGIKTKLKTNFFKSLTTVDPVAAITRYKGPLFVIVGTKDIIVTPQPAAGEIFLTYHDGPEKIMILPTDHGFDAVTGPETVDTMAAASLAFIEGK